MAGDFGVAGIMLSLLPTFFVAIIVFVLGWIFWRKR